MTTQNGNGRTPRYKKAEKSGIYARIALVGPSGAGKSYTALRIAKGLAAGGRVFVLDTERGRILRYADRFDFDAAQLTDYTARDFVQAIEDAPAEGAAVLIIDSGSHAWMSTGANSILDRADTLSEARNGNKFAVWAELTPEWMAFLKAILGVRCHTITTIRAKTKWEVESYTDGNGRTKHKPLKVGTKPEFRDGAEYEFDLWGEIDISHVLTFSKTSEGLPTDPIEKPGEELGARILEWCNSTKVEAWRDVAAAISAREIELDGTLNRDHVSAWFTEKFDGRKRSELSLDEVRLLAANIGAYICPNGAPGILTIKEHMVDPPFDPDDNPTPTNPPTGDGTPAAEDAAPSTGNAHEAPPADPSPQPPTEPTPPATVDPPAPVADSKPVTTETPDKPGGTTYPESPAVLARMAEIAEREAAEREAAAQVAAMVDESKTKQDPGKRLEETFDRMKSELYGAPADAGDESGDDLFSDPVSSTAEGGPATWLDH